MRNTFLINVEQKGMGDFLFSVLLAIFFKNKFEEIYIHYGAVHFNGLQYLINRLFEENDVNNIICIGNVIYKNQQVIPSNRFIYLDDPNLSEVVKNKLLEFSSEIIIDDNNNCFLNFSIFRDQEIIIFLYQYILYFFQITITEIINSVNFKLNAYELNENIILYEKLLSKINNKKYILVFHCVERSQYNFSFRDYPNDLNKNNYKIIYMCDSKFKTILTNYDENICFINELLETFYPMHMLHKIIENAEEIHLIDSFPAHYLSLIRNIDHKIIMFPRTLSGYKNNICFPYNKLNFKYNLEYIITLNIEIFFNRYKGYFPINYFKYKNIYSCICYFYIILSQMKINETNFTKCMEELSDYKVLPMVGIDNGTGIIQETILSKINFIELSLKNIDKLENVYRSIDNIINTINHNNSSTLKESLNILIIQTDGDYFLKTQPSKVDINGENIHLDTNIDNIEKNLIDIVDFYIKNKSIHYIYPYKNENDKKQFIEKIQLKSNEKFNSNTDFKNYKLEHLNEKVIVCGGSGLVGRVLIDILEKNNINVVGTYNSNKLDNLIKCDFFDLDTLEKQILEIKPTICISTIAERRNEICEDNWEIIKKINIDIVFNLASICKKHNIFFIHLSTDYVYDGITPPFSPESLTNPLQNYGKSKLIAEQRILSVFNDNTCFLILRVPVLYSDKLKSLQESAVSLVIKKVMNKVEIFDEDNFSLRRPVFIEDLANFILNCIISKRITGIHCFYNPFDKYTKYEMASLVGKILNKNINNIKKINDKPLYDKALRPIDTELHDKTIHNDILQKNIKITLLEDGLNKLLNKYIHPIINFNDINIKNDIFFLLDLDGTLVDSEIIQWKSYRDALKDFNINYTFDKFTEICHNGDIKEYLRDNYDFSEEMYLEMKKNKKIHMLKYEKELKLIDGVSSFINYLYNNNINHSVVTNSSKDTVEVYKSAIPELNKLKNWITRENYQEAKPSGECYFKAKNDFYNGEKYIIGFENSISGLKSIKNVTDIIYIVTYKEYLFYNEIKNEDVFLIKNFNDI